MSGTYDHLMPAEAEQPATHAGANGKPPKKKTSKPKSQFAEIAQPEAQTDIANGERFTRRVGDRVRFVAPWNRFVVNTGTHWQEDCEQVMCRRYAKAVARSVWVEVGATATAEAVKFAKQTASRSGLQAMIHVAAPDLAISPDDLDGDPMAFNCINGTIDLRTATLRSHRREDYITKLCRTPFDPAATCPRFDEFLLQVFASQDVVDFIQRFIGYTLTGDVREQVLAIFYGCGANGKSTLLTTFQHVLGDYAGQAPRSLLAVKKGEQHPTELASLFGKRLVVATEAENGCRLAESLVKELTGGDLITARRMREDFWTFRPSHKLVMCTNHKPRVIGTDHGIWRRLLLVPFEQVFDGSRKDPTLAAKLIDEAAGVLAWAVRGCLEWQRIGLNPPESVRAATENYRSGEDVIGRFVHSRCLVGNQSFRVKFSDLYAEMTSWCEDGGDYPPSKKAVGQWLMTNGCEEKTSNGRWYIGIAIKADLE